MVEFSTESYDWYQFIDHWARPQVTRKGKKGMDEAMNNL
jgi:hypothetical protein